MVLTPVLATIAPLSGTDRSSHLKPRLESHTIYTFKTKLKASGPRSRIS